MGDQLCTVDYSRSAGCSYRISWKWRGIFEMTVILCVRKFKQIRWNADVLHKSISKR